MSDNKVSSGAVAGAVARRHYLLALCRQFGRSGAALSEGAKVEEAIAAARMAAFKKLMADGVASVSEAALEFRTDVQLWATHGKSPFVPSMLSHR